MPVASWTPDVGWSDRPKEAIYGDRRRVLRLRLHHADVRQVILAAAGLGAAVEC